MATAASASDKGSLVWLGSLMTTRLPLLKAMYSVTPNIMESPRTSRCTMSPVIQTQSRLTLKALSAVAANQPSAVTHGDVRAPLLGVARATASFPDALLRFL